MHTHAETFVYIVPCVNQTIETIRHIIQLLPARILHYIIMLVTNYMYCSYRLYNPVKLLIEELETLIGQIRLIAQVLALKLIIGSTGCFEQSTHNYSYIFTIPKTL